jgi:RNA polymerase sigma-70 factor (ECF subfamily)
MSDTKEHLRAQVEELLGELQRGRRAEQQLLKLVAEPEYREYLCALGKKDLDSRARAQHGPSGVFQDLWVRVRKKLRGFRGTSERQFRKWLRTMYRRLVLDANEQANRHACAEEALPEPSSFPSPSEAIQNAEEEKARRKHLERFLEGLDAKARVIVMLREAYGFPYPKIADAVGDTEDRIRYLCHKAMARAHLPPKDSSG